MTDAEDVVQEAFLRWHQDPKASAAVRSPEAWLVTVVTRLAIDHLRLRRTHRDAYPGPSLPEPVAANNEYAPERRAEVADDLSIAFLALLQQVTDEERAAFVLRAVLGYSYEEVSGILQKSHAAARQLVRRARQHLQHGPIRRPVSAIEKRNVITALFRAIETGDEKMVLDLLAPDVSWISDGGGKVRGVATRPVHGAARVARMVNGIARKASGTAKGQIVELAGEPALAFWSRGRFRGIWSITIADGRVSAFYNIVNPDKLHRLGVFV
jgi:RNA polymerase sigma-70 factor (ECF subfamily)